ncbi:MAG: hypothetical protein AAF957_21785 [Planctomycetota bacterium]
MNFIKENWIWIAAPILLFALVVAAALILGGQPEDQHTYLLR